jgi:hypothetical protein
MITSELAFQHAVNAAGALFGAQLAAIIGFAPRTPTVTATTRTTVLSRSKTALLK